MSQSEVMAYEVNINYFTGVLKTIEKEGEVKEKEISKIRKRLEKLKKAFEITQEQNKTIKVIITRFNEKIEKLKLTKYLSYNKSKKIYGIKNKIKDLLIKKEILKIMNNLSNIKAEYNIKTKPLFLNNKPNIKKIISNTKEISRIIKKIKPISEKELEELIKTLKNETSNYNKLIIINYLILKELRRALESRLAGLSEKEYIKVIKNIAEISDKWKKLNTIIKNH